MWRLGFPAIMSLCHLIEKSPDIADPVHLYAQLVVRPQKDNLTEFAIERLYAHLQRIKHFEQLDEDLIKQANKLELEYKKLMQTRQLSERSIGFQLEPLKSAEEIVKAILALSNQENAEMQRREREEAQRLAQEQAEAEAEAKRLTELKMLFDLEEQRRLEALADTEEKDNDAVTSIEDDQTAPQQDCLDDLPNEAPVASEKSEPAQLVVEPVDAAKVVAAVDQAIIDTTELATSEAIVIAEIDSPQQMVAQIAQQQYLAQQLAQTQQFQLQHDLSNEPLNFTDQPETSIAVTEDVLSSERVEPSNLVQTPQDAAYAAQIQQVSSNLSLIHI